MLRKLLMYSLIFSIVGALGACSMHESMHSNMGESIVHEKPMRGQIVQVQDDQVVLCIGSEDGAEAGMQFNVFEVVYQGAITEGNDNYKLAQVGEIEISSIINGHFARGRVIQGSVMPNNVAELRAD
jgi:hypothetical protein